MSHRTITLGALGTMAVAGLLLPLSVHAQSARIHTAPTAAEALEARAARAMDGGHGIGRAADLLLRAAALRSEIDPTGVGDLMVAANGFYFTGRAERARTVATQAGERALAMGDVDGAAHAFLFAAIIANQQRDVAARDLLIGRADRLAASPLLSPAQRDVILAQFRPLVLVAGAEK